MRYIHVELLGVTGVATATTHIGVGDRVRVKPSVHTPKYKWGSVTHRSVGQVTGEERDGGREGRDVGRWLVRCEDVRGGLWVASEGWTINSSHRPLPCLL